MGRATQFKRRGAHLSPALAAAIIFTLASGIGSGVRPASAQPSSPAPQEAVLDHFLCYSIVPTKFAPRPLGIADQFHPKPWPSRVVARSLLCNPVDKYRAGRPTTLRRRPGSHLVCYQINPLPEKGAYLVTNQLTGRASSRVYPTFSALLCLPSAKVPLKAELPPVPANLDHFKCYGLGQPPPVAAAPVAVVGLRDQFAERKAVLTLLPQLLCNPALKSFDRVPDGRILHGFAHLVCYPVHFQGLDFKPQMVRIRNQFEPRGAVVTAVRERLLCVPSIKMAARS